MIETEYNSNSNPRETSFSREMLRVELYLLRRSVEPASPAFANLTFLGNRVLGRGNYALSYHEVISRGRAFLQDQGALMRKGGSRQGSPQRTGRRRGAMSPGAKAFWQPLSAPFSPHCQAGERWTTPACRV